MDWKYETNGKRQATGKRFL